GALDANGYIGETVDGEVLLSPTMGTEFSGTSLPPGWSSVAWTAGGQARVAGGLLTLDGARARTDALYMDGHSLEFVATLSGQEFEHAGLGNTYESAPWAMFSTASGDGNLYARLNTGGEAPPTLIPGSFFGAPHLYRIDWTSRAVIFSVDNALVAFYLVSPEDVRPVAR